MKPVKIQYLPSLVEPHPDALNISTPLLQYHPFFFWDHKPHPPISFIWYKKPHPPFSFIRHKKPHLPISFIWDKKPHPPTACIHTYNITLTGFCVSFGVEHDLRSPVPTRGHILSQQSGMILFRICNPGQTKVTYLQTKKAFDHNNRTAFFELLGVAPEILLPWKLLSCSDSNLIFRHKIGQ